MKPLCLSYAVTTSSLTGIDPAAPSLVTLMEAAFAAMRMHSSIVLPSLSPAIKYPVKVSPAAVVSTACTGQSFSSAVTSLRMNLACELLRYTDLNIEKIAEETGYENVSSFHRAFQKNVGITPAKYRKNH